MVETMSSSIAWVFDGTRLRRRVASAEPPAEQRDHRPGDDDRLGDRRPAPIWNSGSRLSGDFTRASGSGACSSARAARTPAAAASEGPRAQPRDQDERRRRARRSARPGRRRRGQVRPSRMRTTLHHSEPKCGRARARRPRRRRRRATAHGHCRCIHRQADPQARRRAEHDERRGEEDSRLQRPVEPAADDDAEQDRRDDRPAQHADLAEARGEGRLGIVAERPLALAPRAAPLPRILPLRLSSGAIMARPRPKTAGRRRRAAGRRAAGRRIS